MIYTGSDGVTKFSTIKTSKYKYKKANQFGHAWSAVAPPSSVGFVSEAMDAKSLAGMKPYEDTFGIKLLNKMAQSRYGKNWRDLDKNNELKNFKASLDKYEDWILENKRYPKLSEAYRLGLKASTKTSRLTTDFFTQEAKDLINKTYSSREGGSAYIVKKLKKDLKFKTDGSSIRRYIREEVDAGRLKRVTKFKTQEADPTLPKDRYNIIRRVNARDKRGFTVGKTGTEVLAPAWSTYKISFNTPRNPETTLVPKNYWGTQYFKTLGAAEKALEARKKLDLSRTDEAVRVVNRLIKADPDLANDIARLAQDVYGDAEGATEVLKEQNLEHKMRSVSTDVTRLQEQLAGKIQGFKTKNIARLVLPTGKAAEDILTDITVNTDIGRYGGTAIRNSRMRIISGILNEPPTKFNRLRTAVTKFVASGRHLDEVAGVGATYDVAPGYSSFAQSILEKTNLAKGKRIDLDFARLLRQAVTDQTGPKVYREVKYNTLGEAINAYNKYSKDFAKKHKIFTPTLEYSPGKELDPSKFAKHYVNLRPEAKANVLELAKKGIGIGVGEAQPFEYYRNLFKNANPKEKFRIAKVLNCPLPGRADGGRIGYALGGDAVRCVNTKLKNQTLESSQKIMAGIEEGATGVLGKFRNTAKGLLGVLGKFGPAAGKYGAIAAAGAVAQPLVKQFMNDDPSTYLTDPDQQAGMLEALIEGERPKPRSEILDWGMGAGQLGATAAAIPGSGALYKFRRGLSEAKIPKAGPVSEAGLTAGDYLSKHAGKGYGKLRAGAGVGLKALSGMFTPAGLLATEPLRIAQQRREGESWGDIATDPFTWMGPAFAPSMTKMATAGMKKGSLLPKLLRLGMSRAALAAMGPVGWAGLAASLGWEGRKQYQDYKKGRGFFASDEE